MYFIQMTPSKITQKQPSQQEDVPCYRDIAIPIAFPDNWAKGMRWRDRMLLKYKIIYTQFYRVGHAAILLIERSTGVVLYYDYGRYITAPGRGRARSKETDPKLTIPIKAQFDCDGTLSNLNEIMLFLETIQDATHGHGKTIYSVCHRFDFQKAVSYANKIIAKTSTRYTTFAFNGNNCSSYITNTLIAGCSDRMKKLKLSLPQTIAPTPLGNVVNASENGKIYELNQGVFSSYYMDRKKVFANIWRNISFSLFKNKHLEPTINQLALNGSTPKLDIPEGAQLLSSLGESSWFRLVKSNQCVENEYIIQSFTESGKLNYEIVSKLEKGSIDPEQPYKFVFDCNRLITNILQNNVKYSLYFQREFNSNIPSDSYKSVSRNG